MKKTDLIKKIIAGAKLYDQNLNGRHFLFVGRNNATGMFWWVEVAFSPRNYAHLAGIAPADGVSTVQLYEACLAGRLKPGDFNPTNGDIGRKLDVLPELMRLPWTAKMMGVFNQTGNFLCTEKLAGSVRGCMGFVHQRNSSLNIPNTILRDDIRNRVQETYQVLVVFSKSMTDKLYDPTPISVASFLKDKTIELPDEVRLLIKHKDA